MRAIITGGTGFIGTALGAELYQIGHEVVLLSRNPNKHLNVLSQGLKIESWDGLTSQSWGRLINADTAIINLAGENLADGRWTKKRKKVILTSRTNPGQAVVQAIKEAEKKPRVLIQASAVGFYGKHKDELITEDCIPGTNFQANVCLKWEQSTDAVEPMGVRRVIVRTGLPLDLSGGVLPRLLLPFRMFVGGPIGSGQQWFPWIHMADYIRAMRLFIEHPIASGPYNVSSPNPVTNRQFATHLGTVMQRPSFLPIPSIALKLVLGEMSEVLLEGWRIIPKRLQEMGFEYKYPELELALRDLLKDSPVK